MADLKFGADKTGADYTFGPNLVPEITTSPPVFSGTIANLAGAVSTAFALDVSSHWTNNPTAYAVTTGTLPAGISLSNAGVLSGTPSVIGSVAALIITGTNSAGNDVSNSFSWNITADVTQPTFTGTPLVTSTSKTGNISFVTTEAGTYRIVIVAGGSAAPLVDDVLTGTGLSGSVAVYSTELTTSTAGGIYTVTVPDLTPETTYDVYVALTDLAGNKSLFKLSSIITLAELSNSYITRLEADAYMTTRLNITDWNNTSDNSKERALQMATRELNAMSWKGTRAVDGQPLAWPRTGVYNQDEILLDHESIPAFLQYATAEMALSLLKSERWEEADSKGLSQLTAGPITMKFDRHDQKTRNTPVVNNYIRNYLNSAGMGGANWTLLRRA